MLDKTQTNSLLLRSVLLCTLMLHGVLCTVILQIFYYYNILYIITISIKLTNKLNGKLQKMPAFLPTINMQDFHRSIQLSGIN